MLEALRILMPPNFILLIRHGFHRRLIQSRSDHQTLIKLKGKTNPQEPCFFLIGGFSSFQFDLNNCSGFEYPYIHIVINHFAYKKRKE